MDTATVLAQVYGAVLVVMGVSMLREGFLARMMGEIEQSGLFLWFMGLVTFVSGLVSVELYNVWASDWTLIVTLLGWATLIKGAAIMLAPSGTIGLYRSIPMGAIARGGGIAAIILGAGLLYLGVLA